MYHIEGMTPEAGHYQIIEIEETTAKELADRPQKNGLDKIPVLLHS